MEQEAAPPKSPNHFQEYTEILNDIVEETKFQKHGKIITKLLIGELAKLNNPAIGNVRTRLYDYQIEAVLKTAEYFELLKTNNEEIIPALITAPPGAGKSGMALLLPYVMLSNKVLIVTPSLVISEQIAEAFGFPKLEGAFFLKSGMFLEPKAYRNLLETPHIAKNPDEVNQMNYHNLVIVNAQKFGGNSTNSLSRNNTVALEMAEILNEFDTILIDEAHHYPAPTWENIIKCFDGKKIVFFTATPFRNQNGLHVPITKLAKIREVYSIPREALEGKTIRKVRFEEKPDLKNLQEQLGNDIQYILEKQKEDEPRLDNPQGIVVVRTKKEAKEIAKSLGANATFIISGKDGKQNLVEFTKGNKQIAVVCGMLREGYDNPNVTLCVILMKCQSRVWFEQFCGRCMRMNRNLTGRHPDRTVGIVLSYSQFQQQKMWDAREFIAEEDPVEEDTYDEDVLDLSGR